MTDRHDEPIDRSVDLFLKRADLMMNRTARGELLDKIALDIIRAGSHHRSVERELERLDARDLRIVCIRAIKVLELIRIAETEYPELSLDDILDEPGNQT